MQTAWIRMRRRVTRRLTQIQAVWHSDNIFTNFEQHWRTLKWSRQERYQTTINLAGSGLSHPNTRAIAPDCTKTGKTARAQIARIPDHSNTLADSMFVSLPFWTHIVVVGAIFTSQNCPKCEFNLHFGRFRLVKMVPTTSSYRSLTVHYPQWWP